MSIERVGIVRAVNKPLGFFALLVIGAEAMLGLTASFTAGQERSNAIDVAIAILLTSIFLVGLFALLQPVPLQGTRSKSEKLKLENKILALTSNKTIEKYNKTSSEKIEDLADLKEQKCQEQSLEFAIRSATVGEFLLLESDFFDS